MKKLLKVFRPILYGFLKSDQGKKFVLSILKAAAKQSTNKIDDEAVAFIEARLFPNETTKLQ
jgi:hypothetical protein|tara:strand:+ start:324 stop:509 length:186 start_codon:yes stop_codon:yes gene_type:complete